MAQMDSTAIYAHNNNACRMGHGINLLSLSESLPQLTADYEFTHTRTSMLGECQHCCNHSIKRLSPRLRFCVTSRGTALPRIKALPADSVAVGIG